MNVITIPKKMIAEDLVIVLRREYEDLLQFNSRTVKEVPLTVVQKQALMRARRNLARGKYLTVNELKRKLDLKD